MSRPRVERVSDLGALVPEWEALFREVGRTPFQSPAWLVPWWEVFAPGVPFVVTVRREERLVGLAPLYLDGDQLRPIGAALSDHLDLLLWPEAGPALVDFLRAHAPGPWVMDELLPDAAALALRSRPGDRDEIVAASACPVVRADEVPGSKRRKLRQARARVERLGARRVDADARTWPRLLDALFELHGARWGARGEAGVLCDERVRAFHRRAAPAMLEAGLLRLRGLAVGERIVAVCYGFALGDRVYAYLGGFDPELARESPVAVLLEDLLAEGEELHFLRGREPYKYLWGARDRWNLRRTVRFGEAPDRRALRSAYARMRRAVEERTDADVVARVLEGVEHGRAVACGEDGVAHWERVFDRAARISPEAGVALVSGGDPAVLEVATREIVERLRELGLLPRAGPVLDLGCGIGRIALAIADEVDGVVGVDVSEGMLAEARRRCRRADVRFERTSGLDLAGLPDEVFALVLAVDSFPYLVHAGVAERMVGEIRRVLRPGGALVALNWSYRGDPALDRDEVAGLADRQGLVVLRAGVAALAAWDARLYQLWRPPPR